MRVKLDLISERGGFAHCTHGASENHIQDLLKLLEVWGRFFFSITNSTLSDQFWENEWVLRWRKSAHSLVWRRDLEKCDNYIYYNHELCELWFALNKSRQNGVLTQMILIYWIHAAVWVWTCPQPRHKIHTGQVQVSKSEDQRSNWALTSQELNSNDYNSNKTLASYKNSRRSQLLWLTTRLVYHIAVLKRLNPSVDHKKHLFRKWSQRRGSGAVLVFGDSALVVQAAFL